MLYKYNSVSGLSPLRDHLSRKKTERVAQIRNSGVWCCWASKHQHGNTDHRSPRTSSHINCCMTSSGEGVRCCAAELPPLLLSWTNLARKLPAPHCASNEEHCHQRCSASCCTAEMGKQKWSMGPPNSPACNPTFTKMVAAEDREEKNLAKQMISQTSLAKLF
jgi:hypothetical protein